VVNKDVKLVNQILESLRKEIMEIFNAEKFSEKVELYKKNQRRFNSLLFPPKSEYEIIRIPTLPYPADYLSGIINSVKDWWRC